MEVALRGPAAGWMRGKRGVRWEFGPGGPLGSGGSVVGRQFGASVGPRGGPGDNGRTGHQGDPGLGFG
eukprot:3743444-Lingulodinium_polyedra.AAC.1